jgi:VIT1/CCC1 family predicted Fe2+/Mn2+ transporter
MTVPIEVPANRFPHVLVYSTALTILSLAIVAIVSSLVS